MKKNNSTEVSAKDSSFTSGYKVIEVNMNTATDNLYAVVTPVKIRE